MEIMRQALRRVIVWALGWDQPSKPSAVPELMRGLLADISRWRQANGEAPPRE